MKNIDRIKNLTNWDLAVFIYLVSNNAVKISTCEGICEDCNHTDHWCISEIGEWLMKEEEDGKCTLKEAAENDSLGFGDSYKNPIIDEAEEGFNEAKHRALQWIAERELHYRGRMQLEKGEVKEQLYGSMRACRALYHELERMEHEGEGISREH